MNSRTAATPRKASIPVGGAWEGRGRGKAGRERLLSGQGASLEHGRSRGEAAPWAGAPGARGRRRRLARGAPAPGGGGGGDRAGAQGPGSGGTGAAPAHP